MTGSFEVESVEETWALARQFARELKPGVVVCLEGDLGAGKVSRMESSFMPRTLMSSYCRRSILRSKSSTSTVVATKLTRNLKLSIALSAPMVSRVPMLEPRRIWIARSLMDSDRAFMSVLLSALCCMSS